MIKLVLKTENLQHLEAFIGLAKVLEVSLEMGVESPSPLPARRKSTKARTKKSKRRSGHMQVRVAPMSTTGPPRVLEARHHLLEEFGSRAFQKREAIPILMKKMKLAHRPTGYLTQLMDRGGLVAA